MSVLYALPNFPKHLMQQCPFCDQRQPVIVRGMVGSHDEKRPNDIKIEAFPDMGYSFCNCKNIWYTNWENITQDYYGYDYETATKGGRSDDIMRLQSSNYFNMWKKQLKAYGNGRCDFLEIGSIFPYILDAAKFNGYVTTGLDIVERKGFEGHNLIKGDFENVSITDRYDIIWASHIFEHFKKPLEAAKRCYDLLNDGGLLFVAMPDTFFVNWEKPYNFVGWSIREHHILWDMDTFCEELEKAGFFTMQKVRNLNPEVDINILGDMHLLFKKPHRPFRSGEKVLNEIKKPSIVEVGNIDFEWCSANLINSRQYFMLHGIPGQEHYRLLSWFSKQLFNGRITEIGTLDGSSCLALSSNITNDVVTYDIARFSEHVIFPMNAKSLLVYPKYMDDVVTSDIIFYDADHQGIEEQDFLDELIKRNWHGILILDDIYLNEPMKKFWEGISQRKEDWTDLGHVTGTGVVFL